MLRIIADENIVFAQEAFGSLGELELLPARSITPDRAREADILLVRSVTRVDERFAGLERLRFVGTVTIGTDHLAVDALRAAGIAVHSAPGSNADSVVEYVIAALLTLAVRRGVPLRGRTVGIIGHGNIGTRLARRLPAFGCTVLLNDPPRAMDAEQERAAHPYLPLQAVLAESDVVSLHVPYTRTGPFATHHLLGTRELALLRRTAWLLNTSRGAVVDNGALHSSVRRGAIDAAVLDVWENEPLLDRSLLRTVDIATMHIAGHSFDGKVNGTLMIREALLRELQVVQPWNAEALIAAAPDDDVMLQAPRDGSDEPAWLDAVVRQMYPITRDHDALLGIADVSDEDMAEAFQELRRRYPRRRTFARHEIAARAVPVPFREAVRNGLMVPLAD